MDEVALIFLAVGILALSIWHLREIFIWVILAFDGVLAEATVENASLNRSGARISYSFETPIGGFSGSGNILRSMYGDVCRLGKIGVRYSSRRPSFNRIEHDGYADWGLRVSKKKTS